MPLGGQELRPLSCAKCSPTVAARCESSTSLPESLWELPVVDDKLPVVLGYDVPLPEARLVGRAFVQHAAYKGALRVLQAQFID